MVRPVDDRPMPLWWAALVVACTALFLVFMLVVWWQRRSEARAAREAAMPACVAELGSEATCRAHFDEHGDDCARLTTYGGGRTSRAPAKLDPDRYLRCVVLGVDEWIRENGRRREEQQRQRQRL